MGQELDKRGGRRENWPEILAEQIELGRAQPFRWRERDCCTWTASVVEAMREDDLIAGVWQWIEDNDYDMASVASIKLARSFGGLERAATTVLGVEPNKTYLDWMRGDPVLLTDVSLGYGDSDLFGGCMGIWLGARAAVLARDGLLFAPPTAVKMGWPV